MAKKKFCPQINSDCVGKRCVGWAACKEACQVNPNSIDDDPIMNNAQRIAYIVGIKEMLSDSTTEESDKKIIRDIIERFNEQQLLREAQKLEKELFLTKKRRAKV